MVTENEQEQGQAQVLEVKEDAASSGMKLDPDEEKRCRKRPLEEAGSRRVQSLSCKSPPCKIRAVLTDFTNKVLNQPSAWHNSETQVLNHNSRHKKKIDADADVNDGAAAEKSCDAEDSSGSLNSECEGYSKVEQQETEGLNKAKQEEEGSNGVKQEEKENSKPEEKKYSNQVEQQEEGSSLSEQEEEDSSYEPEEDEEESLDEFDSEEESSSEVKLGEDSSNEMKQEAGEASSKVNACSDSSTVSHMDIDNDGNNDPQLCIAYVHDIYRNLHAKEFQLKHRPLPTYMEAIQKDITPHMREVVVDWLVEVADEYKLLPDTLYLAINCLDRYLSVNQVARQKLQLLGVTCMLIASKYEELSPPQVEEFCCITNNTYTIEEVVLMEYKVLKFLDFELTIPTTKTFLRRFIRASQAENKVPSLQQEFMANYLAELTLLKCKFLKFVPSMLAASAVFLARLNLDCSKNPWNSTLEYYTGYKPSQFRECVLFLNELHLQQKNVSLTATRNKYSQHKFRSVACLLPVAVAQTHFKNETS